MESSPSDPLWTGFSLQSTQVSQVSSVDRILSHYYQQLLLNVFNFCTLQVPEMCEDSHKTPIQLFIKVGFWLYHACLMNILPSPCCANVSFIHHYILLYYHCQQTQEKAREKEQLKRTVCILKLKVSVFDVYLCIWMYTSVYLDVQQCIPVYLDVHQCVPVYLDMWFVAWADQSAK